MGGSSGLPREPGGGHRGAALPWPLAPASHPSATRVGAAAALTVRRTWGGKEQGDGFACPTEGTDPGGRSRPAQQCPASPAQRLPLPEDTWPRDTAVCGCRHNAAAVHPPPPPSPAPQPLTCMQPLRLWQPAGDPGTSSYLELRAGKRGGRGRRRQGEEGRWQDAGVCPGCDAAGVRAPLTAAASGGRAREGGREGGKEGGGKEERREGRKERDPPPVESAAQRPLKEQKPASSAAAAPGSPQCQAPPPPARPAGHRQPQGFAGGRRSRGAPASPPSAARALRVASFQGVKSPSS